MWHIDDERVQIIRISPAYTDFLRAFDNKVPMEHLVQGRLPRPFIGILISNNQQKYVIPLSSPKEKHKRMHNGVDFHKIEEGKYGAIYFNNMVPIVDSPKVYTIIDTTIKSNSQREEAYIQLLLNQLTWLNLQSNKQLVIKKAQNLYESYCNDSLKPQIKSRCYNFAKLEERYTEYEI